jgi:LysM repeat protein
MRKGFVYLLMLCSLETAAQTLLVQSDGGKLFLNHTVAAKENWYSIGRMYNLSPSRDIAPFNNTSIDKGLGIGQKLKIPLLEQNLAQQGQPGPDEVFVPLYHTVKEKEGLFRIGQAYNKVSVDQLKSWNKLRTDETTVGMNLVVGYLRVKRDLSPLAATGTTRVQNQPASAATRPAQTNPPPAQPVNPAPQKEATVSVQPQKTETVASPPPAAKKDEPVTNVPAARTTPPATNPAVDKTAPAAGEAVYGAFGPLFLEQSKGNPANTLSGLAASFKSTSGWKDGKYYVLMNNVSPGTIVKLSIPSTNRYVFAKVLGEIPAGKENEGLLVRVSNAALSQLQVPEGRFDVQLQY